MQMPNLKTLYLCALLACSAAIASEESPPPVPAPARPIVVQNYYYALPGRAEEVYRWRVHASDVRAKIGLARGRVLRLIHEPARTSGRTNLPDVVWECEYVSLAARQADLEILAKSTEFEEVEKHMDTLIRHFERAIFEVGDLPAPQVESPPDS